MEIAGASAFARAAALIRNEPRLPGEDATWLVQFCRATKRSLQAAGAGVSMMTPAGVIARVAASDENSRALEDLQFTSGEGPCIDAHGGRHPVLVPDLAAAAAARWPAYAPAAQERGVRAVFAFPMLVGTAHVGVLDVYRTRTGRMSDTSVALALTFAELAGMVLLRLVDDVDLTLASRPQVAQAQGMLMVQLQVSLDEALVRLRAHAFAQSMPVDDVARAIVRRTLRLELDG